MSREATLQTSENKLILPVAFVGGPGSGKSSAALYLDSYDFQETHPAIQYTYKRAMTFRMRDLLNWYIADQGQPRPHVSELIHKHEELRANGEGHKIFNLFHTKLDTGIYGIDAIRHPEDLGEILAMGGLVIGLRSSQARRRELWVSDTNDVKHIAVRNTKERRAAFRRAELEMHPMEGNPHASDITGCLDIAHEQGVLLNVSRLSKEEVNRKVIEAVASFALEHM